MKAGNVQADMVDSVVVGNVLTAAASDCPYVARHTALRSGLRLETPANTVNRLCGSGFQVTFVNIHIQYFSLGYVPYAYYYYDNVIFVNFVIVYR